MPEDTGIRYLLIYGILQAMFLQQDAVYHLAEALDYHDQCLKQLTTNDIRDIRNCAIGHPTKRDRKRDRNNERATTFHFIARISIEKDGFDMLDAFADGRENKYSHINLGELFQDQRSMICKCLGDILQKLKDEDMAHRERFKNKQLVEIFKSSNYLMQKIYETLNNPGYNLAIVNLNVLKEILEKFKSAMIEREIYEAHYGIKNNLAQIDYALESLVKYFNNTSNKLTKQDAHIFTFFLEHQITELINMAQEIDSDYALGEKI